MNDFLKQYYIQTRQEIDTEKHQRDSLLNFAIAVMGALGFGILQSKDLDKLLTHPSVYYIAYSVLLIITALFWVRRRKLQQIADRWFVLWHLSMKFPVEFPCPSLEELVCPNLTKWIYTIKDTILALALSTPVYALLYASQLCLPRQIIIILLHAVVTTIILIRGLADKTKKERVL